MKLADKVRVDTRLREHLGIHGPSNLWSLANACGFGKTKRQREAVESRLDLMVGDGTVRVRLVAPGNREYRLSGGPNNG